MAVQSSRVTWNGKAVDARTRAGAVRGLQDATEHLKGVSAQRAPHEEGTLERSAVASVDASELKGAVSFDTPYAVRQHEELTYQHDEGRTAKYLEVPAMEESDTIHALIAAQMRRALR